jgi:hypothetical protein
MKLMTKHGSATACQQTPHANHTTRTATIIDALKRRAETVLNDKSLDPQTRAIIRYAVEMNDPWLAKLVRRAHTGESVVYTSEFAHRPETETPETDQDASSGAKIEALAEIICRGADESAAALFVLMATLEDSAEPNVLASAAKHYAFTRCGELNLFGIVDAQVATIEGELLTAIA